MHKVLLHGALLAYSALQKSCPGCRQCIIGGTARQFGFWKTNLDVVTADSLNTTSGSLICVPIPGIPRTCVVYHQVVWYEVLCASKSGRSNSYSFPCQEGKSLGP